MKELINNIFSVQDPVCGMYINPEDSADVDFYKGNIFYFCAPKCKKEFVTDPEKYLNRIKKLMDKNGEIRKEKLRR